MIINRIPDKSNLSLRTTLIIIGLESISKRIGLNRLHALEIGCMYKEDEGLSTYQIAQFINNANKPNDRFISIEYNPEHVKAAKQLLFERNPNLIPQIEFMCGHSLQLLPDILKDLKSIDFVLLDGGAHPEVCLQEFELIVPRLSESALCIIDDLQEISPSFAFPAPRPFGKGTLILPFLAISDYLKVRSDYLESNTEYGVKSQGIPNSHLIEYFPTAQLLRLFRTREYRLISKGQHTT